MASKLLSCIRSALGGTATHQAAQLALDAVRQSIIEGLKEDGEVRIAHFGAFHIKTAAPRRLLLPGSRQEHFLPERKVLRFRSSANLPTPLQNSGQDTQRALHNGLPGRE